MTKKSVKSSKNSVSPVVKGYLVGYNGIQTLGWVKIR